MLRLGVLHPNILPFSAMLARKVGMLAARNPWEMSFLFFSRKIRIGQDNDPSPPLGIGDPLMVSS